MRKKLLLITRNFSRTWGGFEEHVFRLFKMLKNNGFETQIITTDIIEYPKIKGIKVLKSFDLFGYCYTPELSKFIAKESPDIIHIHGWGSYVIEKSLFIGKNLGIPTVLTPHEFFHKENLIKKIYTAINKRLLLKEPDVVITLTRHQKLEIERFTKKCVTIPNGIDTKEFKKMKFKDLGYIISVGRLEKYKGFDIILDMSKRLRKRVVIVGRKTNYYFKLINRIRKDGLDAKIYPNASRRTLLKLLEGASLFVSASKREGFGISIIEALASGLPVISTPVGIAPELPKEFVRTFRSNEELDEAIEAFFGKKKEVFEKARKYTFENFSWEGVIQKHVETYNSLVV
jgi:glycosyltransferase involved in cell wall biosynthesis